MSNKRHEKTEHNEGAVPEYNGTPLKMSSEFVQWIQEVDGNHQELLQNFIILSPDWTYAYDSSSENLTIDELAIDFQSHFLDYDIYYDGGSIGYVSLKLR